MLKGPLGGGGTAKSQEEVVGKLKVEAREKNGKERGGWGGTTRHRSQFTRDHQAPLATQPQTMRVRWDRMKGVVESKVHFKDVLW